MQNKLALYVNNLHQKTRCCDEFHLDNKVVVPSEALRRRYFGLNDFNVIWWPSYDIDRSTSHEEISGDRLAPSPTIIINNRQNRHAQVLYLLKTPVHNNLESSQKSLMYAAAVDAGLALKLDSAWLHRIAG